MPYVAVFIWTDNKITHYSEPHYPQPMIFGDTHNGVQERAYQYIQDHPECMPLNPDFELKVEIRQIPDWLTQPFQKAA